MSRTDRQAATAAVLMALGAPAPFWPLTTSGRQICDAQGRPFLFAIPSDDRDAVELARVVSRLLNEACGVPEAGVAAPLDPDHLDAVREETERAGRQMGRRVGGGR
ncbi:hypothetical protein DK419_13405 [Methylobacterium terrae]|uniref:Uncharacterized protein n=1 Tax=Methylobacterium terrae TaxID=2202827 RepID=A0A2U8WNU2_9HYPH|nr:hypothetical protein [Methylobacterium terrae]AWN47191.1 hypothetical protein DK419_13405 [Methylobacterium terrae]